MSCKLLTYKTRAHAELQIRMSNHLLDISTDKPNRQSLVYHGKNQNSLFSSLATPHLNKLYPNTWRGLFFCISDEALDQATILYPPGYDGTSQLASPLLPFPLPFPITHFPNSDQDDLFKCVNQILWLFCLKLSCGFPPQVESKNQRECIIQFLAVASMSHGSWLWPSSPFVPHFAGPQGFLLSVEHARLGRLLGFLQVSPFFAWTSFPSTSSHGCPHLPAWVSARVAPSSTALVDFIQSLSPTRWCFEHLCYMNKLPFFFFSYFKKLFEVSFFSLVTTIILVNTYKNVSAIKYIIHL